jgi:hypothetical protein
MQLGGLTNNVAVSIQVIRKFEPNNQKCEFWFYGLSKEKCVHEVFPIKHVPNEKEAHIYLL